MTCVVISPCLEESAYKMFCLLGINCESYAERLKLNFEHLRNTAVERFFIS